MSSTDPWWIEPASVIGGFIGTGVMAAVAVFRKTKEVATEGPASVVAASVISDRGLEKVTLVILEAAESHHDDIRRLRESMGDLEEGIRDLTRAVKEGLPPVASVDVAGLMARLNKVERGT